MFEEDQEPYENFYQQEGKILNNVISNYNFEVKPHEEQFKKYTTNINENMSASCIINGEPITNWLVTNKVNPVMKNEYAYLNRNKLVNRRLIIKKIFSNSDGLKALGKLTDDLERSKIKSDFLLANPSSLNEFRTLQNLNLLAQLGNQKLNADSVNNIIHTLKNATSKFNDTTDINEFNKNTFANQTNKTASITILEEY